MSTRIFLSDSVAADLEQYKAFYQKTFRVEHVTTSALAEAMLRGLMAEDKQFAQFLANLPPAPTRQP